MSDEIRSAIQQWAVDGQLACAHAHAIAEQHAIRPIELARIVNAETTIRFYRCQLGLFGYGPKELGQSKIVQPARFVPPEVEAALRAHVREGAIPCAQVWAVAEQFAYPRLGMANIVEALGLKVAPCQLGCF